MSTHWSMVSNVLFQCLDKYFVMITTLHIENYALIQQTDISFNSGFIAITGETGAGKSIILGALGLLTGTRAEVAVLGEKDKKCVVEACFDITGQGLQPLFDTLDIDYDDNVTIRREILPTGKSRAFVGDVPVQLSTLKELGDHLVDIHSQHQTLAISSPLFQTQLLDELNRYDAQAVATLQNYADSFSVYSSLKHRLEQLIERELQDRKEQDYMLFLFNELCDAKLRSGEQEELEAEADVLAHTEQIKEALGSVATVCDGDEEGAVQRLISARSMMQHISSHHKDLSELQERFNSVIIELQDVLSTIRTINSDLEYSPDRQAVVSERLDLIYRLQKKHAVSTIDELLDIQQQLRTKLQGMESLVSEIGQVMADVDKTFKDMQALADSLTAQRQDAARLLEQEIHPVLAQMGMKDAVLQVLVKPAMEYTATGHDDITFLFNANRGGELRPIAKVASGGELSRVTLAIKAIKASQQQSANDSVLGKTMIFDEIDTGVSGDISIAVGCIMRNMSLHNQVIAITHLPQIAAKATQHFKVSKAIEASADRTVSRMRQLSMDERTTEIAVMLSSNPPSSAALQTASELIAKSL